MSYVLICKDIYNMGYDMMSQLLKEKVQRIKIYWGGKKIDNCHQHKYHRKYS